MHGSFGRAVSERPTIWVDVADFLESFRYLERPTGSPDSHGIPAAELGGLRMLIGHLDRLCAEAEPLETAGAGNVV